MSKPKRSKPNRPDGLYEVKITLGKRLDGSLIRKSFYSSISKEDAKKQAEQYKIEQAVADKTGEAFIGRSTFFEHWATAWLEVYKKGNVKGSTYNDMYRLLVKKHLIPYFGSAHLSDILSVDVQSFFNSKKKYSLETLKKMRSCLYSIF